MDYAAPFYLVSQSQAITDMFMEMMMKGGKPVLPLQIKTSAIRLFTTFQYIQSYNQLSSQAFGVVFVYDITNDSSFQYVTDGVEWLQKLILERPSICQVRCIVGVNRNEQIARVISYQDALSLKNQINAIWAEIANEQNSLAVLTSQMAIRSIYAIKMITESRRQIPSITKTVFERMEAFPSYLVRIADSNASGYAMSSVSQHSQHPSLFGDELNQLDAVEDADTFANPYNVKNGQCDDANTRCAVADKGKVNDEQEGNMTETFRLFLKMLGTKGNDSEIDKFIEQYNDNKLIQAQIEELKKQQQERQRELQLTADQDSDNFVVPVPLSRVGSHASVRTSNTDSPGRNAQKAQSDLRHGQVDLSSDNLDVSGNMINARSAWPTRSKKRGRAKMPKPNYTKILQQQQDHKRRLSEAANALQNPPNQNVTDNVESTSQPTGIGTFDQLAQTSNQEGEPSKSKSIISTYEEQTKAQDPNQGSIKGTRSETTNENSLSNKGHSKKQQNGNQLNKKASLLENNEVTKQPNAIDDISQIDSLDSRNHSKTQAESVMHTSQRSKLASEVDKCRIINVSRRSADKVKDSIMLSNTDDTSDRAALSGLQSSSPVKIKVRLDDILGTSRNRKTCQCQVYINQQPYMVYFNEVDNAYDIAFEFLHSNRLSERYLRYVQTEIQKVLTAEAQMLQRSQYEEDKIRRYHDYKFNKFAARKQVEQREVLCKMLVKAGGRRQYIAYRAGDAPEKLAEGFLKMQQLSKARYYTEVLAAIQENISKHRYIIRENQLRQQKAAGSGLRNM